MWTSFRCLLGQLPEGISYLQSAAGSRLDLGGFFSTAAKGTEPKVMIIEVSLRSFEGVSILCPVRHRQKIGRLSVLLHTSQ